MKRTTLTRTIAGMSAAAVLAVAPVSLWAQQGGKIASRAELERLNTPSAAIVQKESKLIQEVLVPELIFRVSPSQSKVIRTALPVARVAITNASVVEVNEFGPKELEIIGVKSGQTTLTIWFTEADGTETILRYLVRVEADQNEDIRAETEFGKLQTRVNEMFPNSQVQLIPVADKLIVRGQARDSQEAAQILAILGGQSTDQAGNLNSVVSLGTAVTIPGADDLKTTSVVNLLHVPGEQQVMLKVRVAELTRTAARELGMNLSAMENSLGLATSLLTGGANISAILDGGDVSLFLRAFSSNGTGKILAEPTLVTLSGQPATFISGGEFAVPTTVGVEGVGAVATAFRGFGTQLTFTPTVIDKDRVRLQVAPSFSTLNQGNSVNGIPGLDTRAVTTTVDLREGQWLAVAGLIQDEQTGSKGRIPFLGDIPILGAAFSNTTTNRNETELVVLVSPELVHPMEAEQVPALLPGMEVTDPTNKDFFLYQQIEGLPGHHHRSTVFPALQHQQLRQMHGEGVQYETGQPIIQQAVPATENYYLDGPSGFSR